MLQELGTSAADIKKLKEGGINTVEALARATKRELCAIKGISEAKVTKLLSDGMSHLVSDLVLFHCLRGSMTAVFFL